MADAPKDSRKQIFTIPNLLSFFRLLLVPVIAWLYCWKKDYPLTALVLVLSGATDIADGFIARHFDMVSDMGKVLDPVADKLTQVTALACLLTRFQAIWWPLGMMVIKETAMTVMGILVIRRTKAVYSAAWHGKLATVMLYAVIFIHIIWYDVSQSVSALLAGLGAACILLSLILYAAANLRRLREAK
ncbi:MAG: CDP-alcohol phosphatidyltransferase family protein [Oscillospiraceae bacterium]|nr:CDP-alcohol phosphatidyltransferase family protein [Oscillospiraceae bacterium]